MSNYQSGPDPSDFIIPDEAAPQPAPSQPASSGFSWAPKVDLSSAFSPFIKSPQFQQNNTIRERQYSGGDTLDEPVWHTLKRDLLQIGRRLAVVVWPAQLKQLAYKNQQNLLNFASNNGVRLPSSLSHATSVPEDDEDSQGSDDVAVLDWDLWGPLTFSLAYSVTMGLLAPKSQTNVVFSGTFSFTWLFYLVVGLNIQLLGGTISFLSAISATGYSMFPLVVGALVNGLLIKWRLIRLIIMFILNAWSVYAAQMSLRCSGVLPGRVFLAIYPVALMYAVLSWLVVIT
ncbi:hypothetical protein CA3LBN_002316 [Candidozyma haemuli]|uniref:Protein YIP n=2 Tax=Candidozyma TaxID=3303203 RepID=A0ABX8I444_9ASCO|nr:hypothetical protein CA3LBN_002316 [[Candida] haemuloni]